MIRNNIIQFPVYQTVKYILSAFSVQKHTILSAFSNKTNCKVTEILLFMQIYFALFGNLAHFYLGTWQNFVWAVGSWLIYLFGLNDFFFNKNTLAMLATKIFINLGAYFEDNSGQFGCSSIIVNSGVIFCFCI